MNCVDNAILKIFHTQEVTTTAQIPHVVTALV